MDSRQHGWHALATTTVQLPHLSPSAGWRSAPSKLHRRSSSGALAEGQQPGGLSRQGTFERQGGAAAAAAAAEASLLAAAAETAAALAAGGMGPGPSGPAGGSGSGSQLARLSAGAMSLLHRTSSTAGAGGGRMHASRSSASLAPSEDAVRHTSSPAAAAGGGVRCVCKSCTWQCGIVAGKNLPATRVARDRTSCLPCTWPQVPAATHPQLMFQSFHLNLLISLPSAPMLCHRRPAPRLRCTARSASCM